MLAVLHSLEANDSVSARSLPFGSVASAGWLDWSQSPGCPCAFARLRP